MRQPLAATCLPDRPTTVFWSERIDAMRSRSVSRVVLTDTVDIPAPPPRLAADWERELSSRPGFEPGDVDSLPLPRARMRWPDYRRCVQAAADWVRGAGLGDVLAHSDIALMACRGARYHHDAEQYGSAAFCNLFLSDDQGLDLHFPQSGHRIALVRGTVVVFDTAQPHAVVPRGRSDFDTADFAAGRERTLVFLTWELPIEDPALSQVLGIAFQPGASCSPANPAR